MWDGNRRQSADLLQVRHRDDRAAHQTPTEGPILGRPRRSRPTIGIVILILVVVALVAVWALGLLEGLGLRTGSRLGQAPRPTPVARSLKPDDSYRSLSLTPWEISCSTSP